MHNLEATKALANGPGNGEFRNFNFIACLKDFGKKIPRYVKINV